MPTELKEKYPFSVDSWTALAGRKRHHFLTHAHSDHTAGIEAFAHRPIYCSDLTRLLVLRRFPKLKSCRFIILEVGDVKLVSDDQQPFSVTALDANHCPGAVMLLFEGSFGNVLHTGDCRLSYECLSNVLGQYRAQIRVLDCLFLDCTFGRERMKMPSKKEAFLQVQQCILDHREAPIVYLACDLLGQEELLSDLVRSFRQKIFIDKRALPEYFSDMMIVAPDLVTEDPLSTRIHVCEGFPKLYDRAKVKFIQAHRRGQADPLFIRPSAQWYTFEERLEGLGCGMILDLTLKLPGHRHKPRAAPKTAERDQYGVWHVCYSIHSSRSELEMAMDLLWPKEVISTTPGCHASEIVPQRAILRPLVVNAMAAGRHPVSKDFREEAGRGVVVPTASICSVKDESAISRLSPANSRAKKKSCMGEKLKSERYRLLDDLPNVTVPLFGPARHSVPASPPLSFASINSQSDEESDTQSSVDRPSRDRPSRDGESPPPSKQCSTADRAAVSVTHLEESVESGTELTESQSADGDCEVSKETINIENFCTAVCETAIVASSVGGHDVQGLAVLRDSTRTVYRSLHAPIPTPLPSLLELWTSP